MSDPPIRPRAALSRPNDVRPAAGRAPGPDDALPEDDVVELSSQAPSSAIDPDRSHLFAFTTGFRRAVLAQGKEAPSPQRKPSGSEITIPSLRRRESDQPSAAHALRASDAPTPVEPSRARYLERKTRRVALIACLLTLGVTAVISMRLLFEHAEPVKSRAPLPSAIQLHIDASTSAAAVNPNGAPRPSPKRTNDAAPPAASAPPRPQPSSSTQARERRRARPVPSGALWFPPE